MIDVEKKGFFLRNIKIIILVFVLFKQPVGSSLVFPPYGHSYGIRKATPIHLALFFGPRTTFDDPQGLVTTHLIVWDDTTKKEDDDNVVVYGVNSGRHQIIFNKSMWALDFYGDKGTAKGCFLFPKGITADEKGNVFVADSGNNRVVHLFNPKSKLEWIDAFTGKTETDGGLKGPSRIALDADEMVYVTDPGNERIVVFSNTGIVKRTIPAQNEIKFENGLTALVVADGRVDKSYYKSEKVLFCADMTGTRLWKIGLNGQVISQVLLPAGYQASYSAVDYYHNVWLTDPQKHCLLKFDHNLKLLDIFGSYGTGDNQFVEPRGIAIHKRFGQVFVAEKKGAQYYWIGTQFKSAVIKKNESGRYLLTIKATEYSFVSLFSYKDTDTLFFLKRQMITPGSSVVSISDIESKIDQSSLFLKIEPTYSSYTYNAWYFPVKVEN